MCLIKKSTVAKQRKSYLYCDSVVGIHLYRCRVFVHRAQSIENHSPKNAAPATSKYSHRKTRNQLRSVLVDSVDVIKLDGLKESSAQHRSHNIPAICCYNGRLLCMLFNTFYLWDFPLTTSKTKFLQLTKPFAYIIYQGKKNIKLISRSNYHFSETHRKTLPCWKFESTEAFQSIATTNSPVCIRIKSIRRALFTRKNKVCSKILFLWINIGNLSCCQTLLY